MTEPPRRAVVTGATGFTGRKVARRLAGADLPLVVTGRDPGRTEELADELGGVDRATVDVTRPEGLADLLRPGDVVANCAGPFTELGEPVVRTCVEAGAHYLDTTGEQTFMKRMLERYDGPAREAGVAVVHAMAFEYAPGDCALAVAADRLDEAPARADVVYAWGAGPSATSPGTRRSILRVMAEPGWVVEEGSWRREPTGRRRRRAVMPWDRSHPVVSFPAGEVVTAPRHLSVETVRGWMVVGAATAAALPLMAPALPTLTRMALPLLDRWAGRGPEGPDREARGSARFAVVAAVRAEDGEAAAVTLQGHDPYGLTAAIVAAGVDRLLDAEGAPEPAGVLPPAKLLAPGPFLEELEDEGVELAPAVDPFG